MGLGPESSNVSTPSHLNLWCPLIFCCGTVQKSVVFLRYRGENASFGTGKLTIKKVGMPIMKAMAE